MSPAEKSREARLRRAAERQGLLLQKSRRRDPYATGFGTYRLVQEADDAVVVGDPATFGLTLDDVERYLTKGDAPGKQT